MPLTQWTHYRHTRAQKKSALHLLALSGVVRQGTIELRYTTPHSHMSDEQAPIVQNASTPATSTVTTHSAKTTHLAQYLCSTAFMLLTKSKHPLQHLQWDTGNAA